MKLEHTASIAAIGPIESIPYGDGKEFKKRILVLDDPEDQYNDSIVFELGGNSIDLADGFQVGHTVTVKANVSCRESKKKPGQFFTGLRA